MDKGEYYIVFTVEKEYLEHRHPDIWYIDKSSTC